MTRPIISAALATLCNVLFVDPAGYVFKLCLVTHLVGNLPTTQPGLYGTDRGSVNGIERCLAQSNRIITRSLLLQKHKRALRHPHQPHVRHCFVRILHMYEALLLHAPPLQPELNGRSKA